MMIANQLYSPFPDLVVIFTRLALMINHLASFDAILSLEVNLLLLFDNNNNHAMRLHIPLYLTSQTLVILFGFAPT